ncbi:hypothetical protein BDV35DRAFT_349351 [Aspergillus flavus]|uniref:Uncharacterized protein n=1 Tax=Aspergillus flavus TaxID=5059 RepID=A0A5N6H0A7_ASPFL|nr:hypothetical protein BDV35DRAFT_349351 [Aspergillus flavus]
MTACSPLNSLQGCKLKMLNFDRYLLNIVLHCVSCSVFKGRYCIFSFGMQYRSIHTSV